MSVSFAGLEGCIIASINLGAALMQPALAGSVNAVLFGCFSVGTLLAPAVVRRLGAKHAMVVSMTLYTLYLLPFIWVEAVSLHVAAVVGGLAGSVLWTAQGVYFTRNAVAYATEMGPGSGASGESKAISLFAGIFAVVFQVSTSLRHRAHLVSMHTCTHAYMCASAVVFQVCLALAYLASPTLPGLPLLT